ncbi:MAG: hypothetical protein ACJAQ1_001728 [Flavobacterium sp.]|jgi:hypothetical protein
MKILLAVLLLVSGLSFSQEDKILTYENGHNGMELIVKSKSEMVVFSTFNSKPEIKEDIVQKLYALYLENKLLDNKNIEITGKDACVSGLCKIIKKNNLISINFHYNNIKWNSGVVEVWKSKKKF